MKSQVLFFLALASLPLSVADAQRRSMDDYRNNRRSMDYYRSQVNRVSETRPTRNEGNNRTMDYYRNNRRSMDYYSDQRDSTAARTPSREDVRDFSRRAGQSVAEGMTVSEAARRLEQARPNAARLLRRGGTAVGTAWDYFGNPQRACAPTTDKGCGK